MIIVSGPIKRSSLDAINEAASQRGIPVIYTRSVGFYSTFSLQLPAEFPIVETHPDPEAAEDLRVTNPWPELKEAAQRISNLDSMDDHDHGHVPYVLLLLHFLEKWKAEHDGKIPETYKEKAAFRELLRRETRTNNAEGGEENFDEAVGAVLRSIQPWSLRSNIREVFEMEQCRNLAPGSDNFWVIASALSAFYSKHGVLPLPGSLPDMKARSADYVALQNIYKRKARQDLEEVLATVRETEAKLGPRPSLIDEREVEVFCKNASHVKLIRGRSIPRIGSNAPQETLWAIRSALENPDSVAPIYVAFEALDAIVDGIQNGSLPGESLDNDDAWSQTVHSLLSVVYAGSNIPEDVLERVTKASRELRRTEGGELHNISSLTGGLVAQEALKVLTRQYVPLDNTCVFDGVGSRSEMFRL